MANADHSDKNRVKSVAALELTAQTSNPIATGNVGIYYDGTRIAQIDASGNPIGESYASGVQALSGAGAVDITHRTTRLTSTGAAQALTLADGAFTGQRKSIIHAVDGGSMVLTPTHLGDGLTTITFTAVRDCVELEWSGTAWLVVSYTAATFA